MKRRFLQTIPAAHQLDLSGQQYKHWSTLIFDHTMLLGLDLSNNQLEEVPEAIAQLKYLQYLDLSNNQLQTLPSSLADLPNLSILLVSNNQLQLLPANIGQLKQLQVLVLKGNQLQHLPNSIGEARALQHLDLAFNPLKELPASLSQLSKLTKLDCTAHQFSTFPEVLLALPQLESIFQLDGARLLNHQLQDLRYFFKVLRWMARKKLALPIRKAGLEVFFGQATPAVTSLYPLLACSYHRFSQRLRQYLLEQQGASTAAIEELAILGQLAWVEESLLEQFPRAISKKTTHLVLGQSLSQQQINQLHEGLCFLSERQFWEQIAPQHKETWIEEQTASLTALLRSEEDSNIALASEILQNHQLDTTLLTDLLLAYTNISTGNRALRQRVQQLFYRAIPNFEHLHLPNAQFQFYSPHKSERSILEGLKNFTHQSKHWDGIYLAQYLFEEYGAGYIYLLEYAPKKWQQDWLQGFIKDHTLCLSPLSKLSQLPDNIGHFEHIKILDLRGCSFRSFPNLDILNQLPHLQDVDLRDNPISFLPRQQLKKLGNYRILLSKS